MKKTTFILLGAALVFFGAVATMQNTTKSENITDISLFLLASNKDFIFSQVVSTNSNESVEPLTDLYVVPAGSASPHLIKRFDGGERSFDVQRSPDGGNFSVMVQRFTENTPELLLFDSSFQDEPITIAASEQIFSYVWDKTGENIYLVVNNNPMNFSGNPDEEALFSDKYEIKRYNVKMKQTLKVENYQTITNSEAVIFLQLIKAEDNNLYFNVWEDNVFNIRIWKYSMDTKESSLVVDLQKYEDEKYKKSKLVGWDEDFNTMYFLGGLNDAGDEERLASYSLMDGQVTEIANLLAGYQILQSPDLRYAAFVFDTFNYPNRVIQLKTVNLITNKIVVTDLTFQPSDDIQLIRWLPDSEGVLVKVNEEYRVYTINSRTHQGVTGVNNLSVIGWY